MADIQKLTIDGETYDISDASVAELAQKLSDSSIFERGTAIASGDDLNDYSTTGHYNSASSSISSTLTNSPINGAGFALFVVPAGGATVQIALTGGSTTASHIVYMYFRTRTSSGEWRAWFQFPVDTTDIIGSTSISEIGNGTITGALATLLSGLTDGSVTKVGTATVGSTTRPIYLNNGVPTAGKDMIYDLSKGSDVELTYNERTGEDFSLVYPYFVSPDIGSYTAYYSSSFKVQDGLLSIEDGATVGSETTPVYLNSGTITASPYPYYLTAGDTFTVNFYGAGYVTSSSTQVYFIIPLSVPLRDFTSITASSQGTFILRQGGYTHGSSADTGVAPSSITYSYTYPSGIRVQATFSSTSGVTNNDAIGIHMADTTFVLS